MNQQPPDDPHTATCQCIWCGSTKTYFKHYECWEENEIGNAITQSTLEGDNTPHTEVWWCRNCHGEFAFAI